MSGSIRFLRHRGSVAVEAILLLGFVVAALLFGQVELLKVGHQQLKTLQTKRLRYDGEKRWSGKEGGEQRWLSPWLLPE